MRCCLKTIFVLVLVLAMSASSGLAKEVSGTEISDTLPAGKQKLILNGAGMRKKLFIKLYLGGLYLRQNSQNAEEIINANEPMAIKLHIVSSLISSEKMEKATREGFEKATDGKIALIQDEIDNFISVFKQDEITEGDVFDLVYLPEEGVKVYKNEEYINTTKGMDFKKALFGIWLSDNPVQDSLKEDMLGLK